MIPGHRVAQAGVTDFKAAIRYVRYNRDLLPGDMDSVFTLGMSGGGAQSALLGASGNSDLYTPYLAAIGAVMTESAEGIWQSGTYYDYVKDVIETSLEHFLSDTEFPYTATSSGGFGGRGGRGVQRGHAGGLRNRMGTGAYRGGTHRLRRRQLHRLGAGVHAVSAPPGTAHETR